MSQSIINNLLEQRRTALTEFCLGYFGERPGRFNIIKNADHLNDLLRLDSLDSHKVPGAFGAEAISCAQKFINAAYRKLEPGYLRTEFPEDDLKRWELYRSYSDWSALMQLLIYPENYMTPFVRPRTTRLFQTLMTDLNQTRLSSDSVLVALRNYLKSFEETCNLEVISAFLHGSAAVDGRYFFVGRERVAPYRYFWREAQIELTSTCTDVNPAAWGEWEGIDVGVTNRVLDMRPIFWGGRPCLVWAELSDILGEKGKEGYVPYKLSINLAFRSQNGDWSPAINLQSHSIDNPPVAGNHLIATVRVSESHPNGCLGVLFDNPANEETHRVVLDALFRPVPTDDGSWLDILAERFTTALTVQHSMSEHAWPKRVVTVPAAGTLTGFYELEAFLLTHSTGDILAVRGVCKANNTGAEEKVGFDLTLTGNPSGEDPPKTEGEFSGRGDWATEWLIYKRAFGGFTSTFTFTFGATTASTGYGRKQFALTMTQIVGFDPAELEKNRGDAAQFLAFNKPGTLPRVRLNSLFGPQLVTLANGSLDAVLAWETQFLPEPASEAGPVNEPNGAFNGANGLYFWELFFHLIHLVAIRLREENRYREAETWWRRVFDPQAIAQPSTPSQPSDKPDYWRCRPLNSQGNLGPECLAADDPYAISYAAPRHFRILTFMEFVNNLIEEGDWYYRQQTRDSLVMAKGCYQQAQGLMGDPPSARSVTDWKTQTLGALIAQSGTRPELEAFEKTHVYSLANVPPSASAAPAMGLFATEPFKLPTNERLLARFQLPRQRLHNLRNWLSIDGKPLVLELYDAPGDPAQLLRDLAAGGNAGPRPMGGRAHVNAYNWRMTFDLAMRSVQALQDYGSQVLRFMEQRDTAQQTEMQQRHLLEQGESTKAIQDKAIAQMNATLTALRQSREAVQQRADGYAAWYEENISAEEYKVMDDLHGAKQLNQASVAVQAAAGAISAIPKVFGMANGNAFPEGVAHAIAHGLQIASMGKQADAEKRAVTEGYRLRRREWGLQRNLALAELSALDEQINAQVIAVEAAQASLQLVLLTNRQSLALYDFLQRRNTHSQLYDWLLAQLKALYYQAYDATSSLCINAQSSLSAQTGNYDSQTVLPQAWSEKNHGLLAAEQLRGYLMRIERDHLQSFERRLERVKIVSLRQLFDNPNESQPDARSWVEAHQKLQTNGRLAFNVSELNFNREHPGEYCRLIRSVEVDCPALVGPYQSLGFTLTQTGSRTVIQPAPRAVEFLHNPEGTTAPAGVLFNTRSGQQIGISQGVADDGRVMEDQDSGLLRAFECTGAVSSWEIYCARWGEEAQADVIASMTDLIVTIRYTTKVGEPTFRLAVENLVTEAEAIALKHRAGRSRNHV
ncbi:neuraminidase-like domain-containing protein [Pseudomonas neuropathica]|uniref:Tc toxin subunit A-related protein n=1 Tax=Pseudomonas neuropathica TaxID=2730425 RepID=UPI003EBBD9C8